MRRHSAAAGPEPVTCAPARAGAGAPADSAPPGAAVQEGVVPADMSVPTARADVVSQCAGTAEAGGHAGPGHCAAVDAVAQGDPAAAGPALAEPSIACAAAVSAPDSTVEADNRGRADSTTAHGCPAVRQNHAGQGSEVGEPTSRARYQADWISALGCPVTEPACGALWDAAHWPVRTVLGARMIQACMVPDSSAGHVAEPCADRSARALSVGDRNPEHATTTRGRRAAKNPTEDSDRAPNPADYVALHHVRRR